MKQGGSRKRSGGDPFGIGWSFRSRRRPEPEASTRRRTEQENEVSATHRAWERALGHAPSRGTRPRRRIEPRNEISVTHRASLGYAPRNGTQPRTSSRQSGIRTLSPNRPTTSKCPKEEVKQGGSRKRSGGDPFGIGWSFWSRRRPDPEASTRRRTEQENEVSATHRAWERALGHAPSRGTRPRRRIEPRNEISVTHPASLGYAPRNGTQPRTSFRQSGIGTLSPNRPTTSKCPWVDRLGTCHGDGDLLMHYF
ncbi:hypothetical protein ISCGN_006676 [Ixodes scapularis]